MYARGKTIYYLFFILIHLFINLLINSFISSLILSFLSHNNCIRMNVIIKNINIKINEMFFDKKKVNAIVQQWGPCSTKYHGVLS